ncbi:MAG: CPBP family intramembrane glutamic endopeptidase [Chloroflexota bacterium]
MGLLYEYSKPEDRVHRRPKPEPEEPPSIDITADVALPSTINETPKTGDNPIRGVDVLLASLFSGIGFCFILVFTTLIYTPTPSADAPPPPMTFDAATINAVAQVYSSAFISLLAYVALLFSVGLFIGVAFIGLRVRGDWDKLGIRRPLPQGVPYAMAMGLIAGLSLRSGTLFAAMLNGELGEQRTAVIDAINRTDMTITFVALLLWIMVLPLVQELFFRGVIYSWLRQSRTPRGAMVISGLINGIFNLYLLDLFSAVLVSIRPT